MLVTFAMLGYIAKVILVILLRLYCTTLQLLHTSTQTFFIPQTFHTIKQATKSLYKPSIAFLNMVNFLYFF
jgi:hypothetical protein